MSVTFIIMSEEMPSPRQMERHTSCTQNPMARQSCRTGIGMDGGGGSRCRTGDEGVGGQKS